MIQHNRKWIHTIAILLGMTILCSQTSYAGFLGHNTKGDFGLQSGSQLPPGWYMVGPVYYNYKGDSIYDRDGNDISIDPQGRGSLDLNLYVLGLAWISEYKILGGNYSFQIYPGLVDNSLEAPVLGLNDSVSTGLTDLYFQPINLGWHTDRADFMAGIGVYAPTGEYELGGSSNRGLGMWSLEFFAGTTIFLDEAKSWHIAATAFYETHSDKEGTDINVGDILTIEGGAGKSFMDGALSVGVSYYGQWKLTDDELGSDRQRFGNRSLGKHEVYGVGPEVMLPLATSKKLYGFLDLRYLWEFGAESTAEGETFMVTLVFPLPSVPLQ